MVAVDCWVDNIERWRRSSSCRLFARDGTVGLDHAIRTGALDSLETGRRRLLQRDRFVHCCCQSMRTASMWHCWPYLAIICWSIEPCLLSPEDSSRRMFERSSSMEYPNRSLARSIDDV